MSHPAFALQQAVFAALRASSTLTALIGDRIYDEVPPNRAFPYVTIGEDQIIPDFEGGEFYDCHAVVHVWSKAKGSPELKRIEAAIHAALNSDIEFAGFAVVEQEPESTIHNHDLNLGIRHAIMDFYYRVQPAA